MSQKLTNPGRVMWREILIGDVEKARRFYGALFGWTFDAQQIGGGTYTVVHHGARALAGIMEMADVTPAQWVGYVWVEDVDAAVARAKERGATPVFGPTTIENVGRTATLRAEDGAMLALMCPGPPDDQPAPPPKVGDFCWETVTAADVARAKQTWTSIVPNWHVARDSVFAVGDTPRDMIADVRADDGRMPIGWTSYVFVESLEATILKAKSLGGRQVMAPEPVPGMGRAAVIADDAGATLGLFQHAPG